MKFCPNCGAKKLREQDRFCMNCGEPYPTLAEAEPAAPATGEGAPAEAPATAAPAQPEAPESLFDTPAPVPSQTAPAAEAPTSSATGTSVTAPPPTAEMPAPAAFQPVPPAAEPVIPAAQPPAAPVQPAQQAPVQPAYIPQEPAAPSQPAAQEVEAEAASLRDSIDKMLGSEAPPEQPAPLGNLFDTGAVDTTAPAVAEAPFAGNVFDEGEAAPVMGATVFEDEAELQYDEYGNPIAAYEEEAAYTQPAEVYTEQDAAGQTLGFDAPAEDDGALFENGTGNDGLFESSPAPRQHRQQHRQQAQQVPQQPARRQRVDELAQAVESAAGPDTEKWQRLQQDDLQDLYAREERKQKPPEIPLPEYSEKRPKKRRGGTGRTVAIIVMAVIVFAIGTLGATMGLLYYRNSPGKTIDAFIEGIEERNYTGLNGMVQLTGVEGTTDGWAAFCDAFESASAKRDLQNQLKNQAKKGATGTDDYPAVVMESEPLFLFVNRYYITIQGVDLLAEGIFEFDASTINGLTMNGEASDAGRLFSGMMPGRYTYEIYYNGGTELSGEIDAFAVEGTNKLVGNGGFEQPADASTATVTVSNCISDDATLYVANVAQAAKPSGGVVTLENVTVGNEIRIEATVDGETKVARVAFNDINQTSLAFGEYSAPGEQPATGDDASSEASSDTSSEASSDTSANNEALARAEGMSASDINGVLGTFYQSYLTSINDQTTNTLKNSTSANTTAMAERITSSNNSAYTFEYVGVNVNASSIKASAENGVPTLTFTADFTYRYTPRDGDGKKEDGGNRQDVTMIYEDGEWRVHSMAHVSTE